MQDDFVCVAQDEKWLWTRLVGIILIDGPHRSKRWPPFETNLNLSLNVAKLVP
jgi:hypothetical protein